jgi:guanosine-3',5'-bis(diphosphate) 3'-pyrophosphohydrolase
MTERLDEGDHDEFLENVKLEMYSDQVFCFTPKGDVVQLPRGATPLDYAYSIHTRIGNSCVSAKIDGIRVPLWTRLKNGQSVEIITAEGQKPQSSWIDIVATGRAKAAIRKSLREEDRGRFVRLGTELSRAAFEHIGKKSSDKALRTAAKMLGYSDDLDLLAALGAAELTARKVVETLYPELAREAGDEIESTRAVLGLTADQTFRRAPCCQPLPGERIVGITYRGQGVLIHAIDCPALEEFEEQPNRWVDLHWHSGRHAAVNTVALDVAISNDAGVLGRICTLIGEQKANISDLRFTERKPDFYRLIIDVDLRDVEHLHMVMTALEAETDVAQVSRIRDMTRKP